MGMSNLPANNARTQSDNVVDLTTKEPLRSDRPSLFANALKGLAAVPTNPAVRMDAVRVLAMALITALECEGSKEADSGPAIKLRDEVQRFEANLIRSALAYTGGRQRRAARLLGINVHHQ